MPTDRTQFIAASKRQLRAPYNFVRLNETVLPSPLGSDPNRGKPLENGLCGEITVRWHVETPLLVGGKENNQPFRLSKDGPPVIPGASLRGMIRSVLEIASFSRLNFVDDGHFAIRDFSHATWKDHGQLGKDQRPRAGWLSWKREEKTGKDKYWLTPCDWRPVPIDRLCRQLGLADENVWHDEILRLRRQRLASAGLAGDDIDLAPFGILNAEGTLVVTGKAVRNQTLDVDKHAEAAFFDDGTTKEPIGPKTFARFDCCQHVDGNDVKEPDAEANWSYWRPRLLRGERVPVYFVGELAKANDPQGRAAKAGEFFMSLTRFLKVPYDQSILELAHAVQPVGDDDPLDLCEALFGWVPPETDPDQPPSQRERRARAWASRVFFRHAELENDSPPIGEVKRSGVTMKPRASFYPFYLKPKPATDVQHPVDYSNPRAILAGRKRYPPRDAAAAHLPQPPDEARAGNLSNELTFLAASPQRPLTFVSRIRVHNVSPEELGGLLWAITFGRPDDNQKSPYRHMLGRAKAFGYGQVRAEVLKGKARIERTDGKPAPKLADLVGDFEKWVEAGTGTGTAFADLLVIRDLLALANRSIGSSLAPHLRFPRKAAGAKNEAEATLKGYQEIKKQTGRRRAINPDDPADGDFLFLPEYPLT